MHTFVGTGELFGGVGKSLPKNLMRLWTLLVVKWGRMLKMGWTK